MKMINNQLFCFVIFIAMMNLKYLSGSVCPTVTMIQRHEWMASETKPATSVNQSMDYVFIIHTGQRTCHNFPTCSAVVREIQRMHHIDRGWDDIGYNFLIGGDGRVYVGRGWGKIGAHTLRWNSKSHGIAFIGSYSKELPSRAMLKAAQYLINCGVKQGFISSNYGVYGHRDARCTESPGQQLYKILSSWPHWHALGPIKKICPELRNWISSPVTTPITNVTDASDTSSPKNDTNDLTTVT